jgi:hypothetical protein
VSVAAVAALLFVAPWSRSPSFLARADAALTPPAGMIVHEKWQLTSVAKDLNCTVKHKPTEIWIDETRPYRYRVLLNELLPLPANYTRRAYACSAGAESEIGGSFDSGQPLRFVPPNTLVPTGRFGYSVDSVKDLRDAIRAGTAHDEGKTQLDGRTVERIRTDPPAACSDADCFRKPRYTYVDPKTFQPVEDICDDCGSIKLTGLGVVRFRMVKRFLTYEYLPRTKANLALTSIRAQHPTAAVGPPCDVQPYVVSSCQKPEHRG